MILQNSWHIKNNYNLTLEDRATVSCFISFLLVSFSCLYRSLFLLVSSRFVFLCLPFCYIVLCNIAKHILYFGELCSVQFCSGLCLLYIHSAHNPNVHWQSDITWWSRRRQKIFGHRRRLGNSEKKWKNVVSINHKIDITWQKQAT